MWFWNNPGGERYSGTVEGLPSQQAGPKSVTVRRGVLLLGHRVQAYDQNPFILNGQNGDEIPSTKLWISDIHLSCASEDIESAPSRLGVVLQSKLIQEERKNRNRDGKLTHFLTGRRFVFMNVPSVPLSGKKREDRGFQCTAVSQKQPKMERHLGSVFALSPAGSPGHRAPERCDVQGVVRAVKRGDPTCSCERAVNNQPIWGQSGRAAGEVEQNHSAEQNQPSDAPDTWLIVQELCESRGGRPELSVLTSLLVSVDIKNYCTVLRHWSQLVPNMSTDI